MKDEFTAKARDDEYARYSRALSGLETGDGNSHHAIKEAAEFNTYPHRDKKDKEFSRTMRFLNELQRLLQDPAYATAHKRANTSIDTLNTTITDAMDDAAERMAHLESLMEDMIERAATLDDGTAVFRNAQGEIIREDGTILSPTEAAGITIPDDAPSWEQYSGTKDALTKARQRQDRLSDIQRQLLEYKDKLNDPNNPLTLEEIEELQDKIHDAKAEVESHLSVKASFDESLNLAPEVLQSSKTLDIGAAP